MRAHLPAATRRPAQARKAPHLGLPRLSDLPILRPRSLTLFGWIFLVGHWVFELQMLTSIEFAEDFGHNLWIPLLSLCRPPATAGKRVGVRCPHVIGKLFGKLEHSFGIGRSHGSGSACGGDP